jgi:SPP1 gp7 family putative phage head morphogenesis protein
VTYNQQFYDASIRHQIDLLRYGSGVSQKVNRILDETRADLRKQVERRLGKNTSLDGPGLRRLRELEKALDQRRSAAWNDVNELWERSAVEVALEEPVWLAGTLTSILPVELDLVTPSDATLRALATHRPFQGKNLKEWAGSVQRADLGRIHQQIRIGMVQGESSRDIARRVFGARGAMAINANQADAVTRTVIAGVANAAQQEFLKDNSDLFEAEQLVATLDARTTPICRAVDGSQFPVGEGPIPPLHVRCRSIRVAVIDGEVVGERPFKAGTEQQMLDEFTAQRGLEPVSSRSALPKGTKKDFDAFSRRRMRELTGQVPAKTTYQQWLAGQSTQFQDDVLGPARGKLFREGGLTLDKFVNRQGDELTLDELRERNRDAFGAAGLGSPESKPRRTAVDRERERAEKAEREATAPLKTEAEIVGALKAMNIASEVGNASDFSDSVRNVFGRDLSRRDLELMTGRKALAEKFGDELNGKMVFSRNEVFFEADTLKTRDHADGVSIARRYVVSERTGERSVFHDHFFLGKNVQGTGLGKSVLSDSLRQYKSLGLAKVELTSAEVGKYYWPSIGFELADQSDLVQIRKQFVKWFERSEASALGVALPKEAAERMVGSMHTLRDMVNSQVGDVRVGKEWAVSLLGPGANLELDLSEGSAGWQIAKTRLGL